MPHSSSSSRLRKTHRPAHLVLPCLVVLLAFGLRVYRLPEVPFGFHPDEATKALLARDLLAGKAHPVFFTAFTGRDALYVYLEAAAFALAGERMLAARLVSAFAGVLTVAATVAAGRAMFNRRIGVLAAVLLAVSLWHLIASRNAYRAVIQPLVQLPVWWALFAGWRRPPARGHPWREFAVAGLFLGLTQYTYTAARAFPVAIAAAVALALLAARRRAAPRWQPLALLALVAALTVLPLALYFWRHPGDLVSRTSQISVFNPAWSGGEPWQRLWRSVVETARMATVWGDPNYRFNVAGQPVFGVLDGLCFYAGLAWCLWLALRRPRSRAAERRRVACLAVLAWVFVMLLPMAFSAESLPYYQRAIGVLPGIYLLSALALDGLALSLQRLGAPRRWRAGFDALVVLLVAWLGMRVARDYFVTWHTAVRNDDDRRVAMVYVADYLRAQGDLGELYLSTEYPQHPTLAFLAPERFDSMHWFDAQQSLPLPPPGSRATYVMVLEKPPSPILMARAVGLRSIETGSDRFGRPVFEVYRWQGAAWPQPDDQSPPLWSWEVRYQPGDPDGLRHVINLPVDFGHVLAFEGSDRDADAVAAGKTMQLVLYWRTLRRPERHYSLFAHLLDDESQIVAEYDDNRYPALFWREEGGELLLSAFPLQVRAGTPPGEYRLEIGVYHQGSGERLSVYDGGAGVADRLLLRPVRVY